MTTNITIIVSDQIGIKATAKLVADLSKIVEKHGLHYEVTIDWNAT